VEEGKKKKTEEMEGEYGSKMVRRTKEPWVRDKTRK
jgi:hypothetical protein